MIGITNEAIVGEAQCFDGLQSPTHYLSPNTSPHLLPPSCPSLCFSHIFIIICSPCHSRILPVTLSSAWKALPQDISLPFSLNLHQILFKCQLSMESSLTALYLKLPTSQCIFFFSQNVSLSDRNLIYLLLCINSVVPQQNVNFWRAGIFSVMDHKSRIKPRKLLGKYTKGKSHSKTQILSLSRMSFALKLKWLSPKCVYQHFAICILDFCSGSF